VRSERAGHRVMKSITRFITQRLKLKVNETKSAVARPQERKFLGYTLWHSRIGEIRPFILLGLADGLF
jgi:retron-type reverse transcriptase